jgi:hypothetical protein
MLQNIRLYTNDSMGTLQTKENMRCGGTHSFQRRKVFSITEITVFIALDSAPHFNGRFIFQISKSQSAPFFSKTKKCWVDWILSWEAKRDTMEVVRCI